MQTEPWAPAHELFEHTADVGLRVRAANLDDLFAEAARGVLGLLVENPADVRPVEALAFDLAAQDDADLLLDWLSELLYVFEARRLLLCEFDVQVADGRLHAHARGERVDPGRHRLASEVKAVTYHGLALEHTAAGWCAELVLDI